MSPLANTISFSVWWVPIALTLLGCCWAYRAAKSDQAMNGFSTLGIALVAGFWSCLVWALFFAVLYFATSPDADGPRTSAVYSCPVPASDVDPFTNPFARQSTGNSKWSYHNKPSVGAVGRPAFFPVLNRAGFCGQTRDKVLVQARPNLPTGGNAAQAPRNDQCRMTNVECWEAGGDAAQASRNDEPRNDEGRRSRVECWGAFKLGRVA